MGRRVDQPAELLALGRRLQQLREGLDRSQAEFALASGLRVETLQRWEQGRSDPGVMGLHALARALGVKPSELLLPAPAGWVPLHVRPGRPRKAQVEVPTPKKRGRPRKTPEG